MPLDLAHPDRTIQAGVVLTNGETELLDVAPIDLLNGMIQNFVKDLPFADDIQAQALDIQFHWVNEAGGTARVTGGLTVQATDSFADCPPLDIILMGAHDVGYQLNDVEKAFIRKQYESCSAFIAICGGMIAPLSAGLLHGKTVTAPRFMLEMLRQQAPDTSWVERRWCRDGKIWTSGALLNGLDLMREFALQTWGERELTGKLIDIGGWPDRNVEYTSEDKMKQ